MEYKELQNLVIDDRARGVFRVNRRAFTDPAVLEYERREIFDRCWLYAGHESEMMNPSDFVTRKVAGRPLLLVRSPDGQPKAFLNSCTHRGNVVCREKSGSARVFSCFYHAWTFNTRGELIGVPGPESYTEAFDKKALGLKEVPRFESYRGMMFVCFDPNVVDLRAYLGEAREELDYMLDFGSDDVEIVPGSQLYSMRSNWKLLVENSIDGYHGLPTHQRYFRQYFPDIGADMSAVPTAAVAGRGAALGGGGGHAMVETPTTPTPLTIFAKEELAGIRQTLDLKFGKQRAHNIADYDRNLFIFPNLILISLWRTVRTFYPISPDYMEVDSWALMPKNESQNLRQKRYENFISFLGPAGFGTPDDVSALEGCQRGFATNRELQWSDLSRGMGGAIPSPVDELQMRAFWRRWHALMQGKRGPTDCSDHTERLAAAE